MMEKARIQIVEDDRIIALGIQGTLNSLGYSVSSVFKITFISRPSFLFRLARPSF